ncbi:MAG TPA: NADH-quinone oxidoreductase subunit NuoK [Pirellulaceae bacterium]
MNTPAFLQHYVTVGALLFGLGLVGFLVRRNIIVMFLCVELMLQGVSLILVGWGRFHDDWSGQMLVTFMIAVAACEAGIVLVLVLMLCQYSGSLDIADWQTPRESNVARFVDHEVPEAPPEGPPHTWPTLTPAGVRPRVAPDADWYRPKV